MKQKTETWLLLVILLYSQLTTMHVRKLTIRNILVMMAWRMMVVVTVLSLTI